MSRRAAEPDPTTMEREELIAYLRSHPTVSLWPFSGKALGCSRSLAYQCAKSGDIDVLVLGHRRRVRATWLERALGLDQQSDEKSARPEALGDVATADGAD